MEEAAAERGCTPRCPAQEGAVDPQLVRGLCPLQEHRRHLPTSAKPHGTSHMGPWGLRSETTQTCLCRQSPP